MITRQQADLIAAHEAGHALAALLLDRPAADVIVRYDPGTQTASGYVGVHQRDLRIEEAFRPKPIERLEPDAGSTFCRRLWLAQGIVTVAGPAAEEIKASDHGVTATRSGWLYDLMNLSNLSRRTWAASAWSIEEFEATAWRVAREMLTSAPGRAALEALADRLSHDLLRAALLAEGEAVEVAIKAEEAERIMISAGARRGRFADRGCCLREDKCTRR